MKRGEGINPGTQTMTWGERAGLGEVGKGSKTRNNGNSINNENKTKKIG